MERAEAIKKIRQTSLPKETMEILETLIPELRESEDERIRKELIEAFEAYDIESSWNLIPVKHILAWLEKQKESPKKELGKYSEEEELAYRLNWVMQDYYKAGKDDEEKEHRFKCYKLFWDALEDENFFEQKEQKTAGWSEDYREEDIQTRFAFYTYKDDPSVLYLSNVFVEETSRNHGFGTRILKAAEKAAEAIGAITICLKVKQDSPANAWYRKRGYGYVAFEDGYDWLEKNLEYLKPAKSAEWSEEDTEMYINVASSLRGYACGLENEEHKKHIKKELDWFENRFKSLRPRQKVEWSEEDKKMRDRIIDILNRTFSVYSALGTSSTRPSCPTYKDEIDWLKSLRPQPKAEWSEEDKDMLNSCISSIEEAKENRYAYKETDGDTSYDHEIDWLKTLPERFNPQPKQEWSEDDENIIKNLIELVDAEPYNNFYESSKDTILKWLKSIRPSWKPSEER